MDVQNIASKITAMLEEVHADGIRQGRELEYQDAMRTMLAAMQARRPPTASGENSDASEPPASTQESTEGLERSAVVADSAITAEPAAPADSSVAQQPQPSEPIAEPIPQSPIPPQPEPPEPEPEPLPPAAAPLRNQAGYQKRVATALVQLAPSSPDGIFPDTLTEITGINPRDVRQALRHLMVAGEARRVKRGKYLPAAQPLFGLARAAAE